MKGRDAAQGGVHPVLAFLISPIPVVVLFPLVARVGTQGNRIGSIIFIYLLVAFLQLVIAAPLRWLLAKRGWRSLWIDTGLGAVALSIPTAIYAPFTERSGGVAIMIGVVMVMAIFGAITGLAYGLLRLRARRASTKPTVADLAARFD